MRSILDKRWMGWAFSVTIIFTLQLGMNDRVNGQETSSPSPSREVEIKEAQTLNDEAVKLIGQGAYDEAMPKAARALEIRERTFGSEHPQVANSLNNLAYIFYKKNNFSEAKKLYERALIISEKLKLENQDAANLLNNLGILYYTEGEYVKAEQFFRRALAMQEKIPQGLESPVAVDIITDLAIVLLEKADYAEAQELFRRALTIQEKKLGPDNPGLIPTMNYLAMAQYQMTRYDEAMRLLNQALDIVNKKFEHDPPVAIPVISNLLMLYTEEGNYEKAESLVQRDIALLETNAGYDSFYISMGYNNVGQLYKVRGDYKKAELFFRRAIDTLNKSLLMERPYAAEVLTNLGLLYAEQGEYDKAEDLLQRAKTMRQKLYGPDHANYATSLANLADLYLKKGEYFKAKSMLEQALSIYRKTIGEVHPYSATVINNLGFLYYSMGDFKKAEELFQRALKIREQVLRPGHTDIAVSLSNLASCYTKTGRLDAARASLQRALTIFEQSRGPNDPSVAQTLNDLGLVHYYKGEWREAEPLFRRTLTINEKAFGSESFKVIPTLNNLALLYQALNDLNRAEQFYQMALAIFKKSRTTTHPMLAEVLRNFSSFSNAKGDIARAVDLARRAGVIEERNLDLMLSNGSEDQNRTYLRMFQSNTMMDVSLHIRDAPNSKSAARLALTTLLRRKGRVLDVMADSLRALRDRSNQADRDLLDKLSEVRSQLAALVSQSLERTGADYDSMLAAKLEEYQGLEARMSAISAELKAQSQPVTIESIQKLIPQGASLIEFVCYKPFNAKTNKAGEKWSPRHYAAYVLHHSGEVGWADLGEAQSIDYSVWNLRVALRNPSSRPDEKTAQAWARTLYKQIMRPVRKFLGNTKQLFISPDSSLQLIPFEALMDQRGRYLIERYSFTYLSSGRDLQRLQFSAPSRRPPVIIANPDFNKGETAAKPSQPDSVDLSPQPASPLSITYVPLTGTEEEAKQIAKLFPDARILKGAEATEAALKRVQGPSILHIGTHGFFPKTQPTSSTNLDITKINGKEVFKPSIALLMLEANPTKSGLEYISSLSQSGIVLAGANNHNNAGGDDGLLTAFEMSGLDLRGTKLVVLSACETGLSDIESGNGIDGLRRSLVLAGAESQVISLWKVNDATTRDIMIKFYTRLRAGMEKSEALRQVKLDMLRSKEYSHPYSWASFINSGSWKSLGGK